MTGHTRKEAIICQESKTNQLNMVDTTINTISIIINTDLSIQITHSAPKTQATVATQAVITRGVEDKAIINTITKAIAAIRINLAIMLLGAKVGRQALRITTPETTLSQITEVVVTIMILIME